MDPRLPEAGSGRRRVLIPGRAARRHALRHGAPVRLQPGRAPGFLLLGQLDPRQVFERLGFSASHFEVRKGNTKVIAFHQKFGAQVIAEDDDSVYMRLTKADFEQFKPKLIALVSRASEGTNF